MGLKPGEECFSCFRRGFSEYTRRSGLSREYLERYLASVYSELEKGMTPPLAGSEAWRWLRKDSLQGTDIYSEEKAFFTKEMLSVYGILRNEFLNSENPPEKALAASTWCNLLDVGQGKPLPSKKELMEVFAKQLAADERSLFLGLLEKAETLLILGDNAGETVMDRLFLELSGFRGKRYYMTRQKPVMNDAVISDAEQAGLHLEAELVSGSTDAPSVLPEQLKGKALDVFNCADLIIAKGQGNFEGLFGLNDSRIFHSFVVKCPVISRATGLSEGHGVFSRFTEEEN
ncbi:hypothetical protein CSA37_06705 [Candidatus Fermentibacteria bacterium]|nr:MAG: hypothetical protein CSA37_06705 [Candidatus Fermentibacteria bacterium]